MEERELYSDYNLNVLLMRERLRVSESFDIIERHLSVAGKDTAFFYIDGFVKDGEMLRIMQCILAEKELATAEELERKIPYVEVEISREPKKIIRAVLSGQTAFFAESFGA